MYLTLVIRIQASEDRYMLRGNTFSIFKDKSKGFSIHP